jgi:1-acyl-sn-glycerol-3-phosphate acyltransferase
MVWWFFLLALHLFEGLFTCAVIFPFSDASRRERLIQRWSARMLAICGVTLEVIDRSGGMAERALIVSNHVSWLDISVIDAFKPCRFVAKADIRNWPLIGWLCAATGTIFISQGKRRDVRRIYEGLVVSIRAGDRVAFFPEGTTVKQGAMLPFHANLFEAAIEAGVPIQPMAVRYLDKDGRYHRAAEFIGNTSFAQNLIVVLKNRSMRAQLIILPPVSTEGAHRRELAASTRQMVEEGLGPEPKAPAAVGGMTNVPTYQ